MRLLPSLLLFFPWASGCATPPTVAPEDAARWVDAHNRYRALHNTPPIAWSTTLAESAQSLANRCPTGHSKTQYGENLAWVTIEKPPEFIVQLWYDEEQQYNYRAADFSPLTGHFTQLIWRGTTEIGCGHAKRCNTKFANVWVCHYNPQGNILEHFRENFSPKAEHQGTLPASGSWAAFAIKYR